MGIFKLLVIGLAVWVALRAVRAWRARSARPGLRPPRIGGPMVRCAHCGVHVPADRALGAAGERYCSAEHRDAAGGRP